MKFKILSCLLVVSTIFSVQAFTVMNSTTKNAYLYGFSPSQIIVSPGSQYQCDLSDHNNFSEILSVSIDGVEVFKRVYAEWVDEIEAYEKKHAEFGVNNLYNETKVLGIVVTSAGKIEAKIFTIGYSQ